MGVYIMDILRKFWDVIKTILKYSIRVVLTLWTIFLILGLWLISFDIIIFYVLLISIILTLLSYKSVIKRFIYKLRNITIDDIELDLQIKKQKRQDKRIARKELEEQRIKEIEIKRQQLKEQKQIKEQEIRDKKRKLQEEDVYKRKEKQKIEKERQRKEIEGVELKEIEVSDLILKEDEKCYIKESVEVFDIGIDRQINNTSFNVLKGNKNSIMGWLEVEAIKNQKRGLLYITNQRIILSTNAQSFNNILTDISEIKTDNKSINILLLDRKYTINSKNSKTIELVLMRLLQELKEKKETVTCEYCEEENRLNQIENRLVCNNCGAPLKV